MILTAIVGYVAIGIILFGFAIYSARQNAIKVAQFDYDGSYDKAEEIRSNVFIQSIAISLFFGILQSGAGLIETSGQTSALGGAIFGWLTIASSIGSASMFITYNLVYTKMYYRKSCLIKLGHKLELLG